MVLELMSRKQGAAMSEIGKATGWQNHTIRGFISGNVTKKMGLAVESFKNEAGERIYRIFPKPSRHHQLQEKKSAKTQWRCCGPHSPAAVRIESP
jgi:hypothetical protein